MGRPSSSSHTYPWQATLEGILSNLNDEFQVPSNTNALDHQPAPRELTTEALFMLNIILIFLILTLIGSSIGAIEFFCKEFRKEIRTLVTNGKTKGKSEAVYEKAKEVSFESSVCAGIKSRDWNIYSIKQVLQDGLDVALKLTLQNDVWKNCKKYLECFSIQNNGRKMLSTVSGEEQLNFLHGLKTIGLFWVSISHICMFYSTIIRTVSPEFQFMLELPTTQFVVNGIFANDLFFTISGFMNGYMFFEFYKKRKGKIPWLLFYMSRILRFTPLYLIILGIYSTLFSYIGYGPAWPTYNTNPICRDNWIWNILYLNNFTDQKKQCMLATWYIACDLQMYFISPIFLLLLMRRPKLGGALIVACVFGSCLTSFMLTKHFQLIDGISKLASHSRAMKAFYSRFWVYFEIVYVKPYTRIGSYLIGIYLGYFIFQRKNSDVKKNNLVTLVLGWTMSLICSFIAFFAIYNREESQLEVAVYNGLKHLLCSLSTSWIIFVCATGQGGFFNRLLSNKFFVPISRLSYSFYFIHFIAIEKYFLSIEDLIEFSLPSGIFVLLLMVLYVLVWSFVVSFVVSLIFERPLLNMLGLLLRETKPENKVQ